MGAGLGFGLSVYPTAPSAITAQPPAISIHIRFLLAAAGGGGGGVINPVGGVGMGAPAYTGGGGGPGAGGWRMVWVALEASRVLPTIGVPATATGANGAT